MSDDREFICMLSTKNYCPCRTGYNRTCTLQAPGKYAVANCGFKREAVVMEEPESDVATPEPASVLDTL